MFKIKFSKAICVLSVLFLFSSCVSNKIVSKGKTPSWVTSTEHEYTKNKYEKLIKQQGQLEQKEPSYGIIDLSDGNKVNYDANFGPSFDIK